MKPQIDSFLSAKLYLAPRKMDSKVLFISNIGGHLSLYAMADRENGSLPEGLLPPQIALQNPELIGGYSFVFFPKLRQILVMMDHDGDENYEPMLIPSSGGFPVPAFPELANYRSALTFFDTDSNIAYFASESRTESMTVTFQANLNTGELIRMYESTFEAYVTHTSADNNRALMVMGYAVGDTVLLEWRDGSVTKLAGEWLDGRTQDPPLNAIDHPQYTSGERGALFITALFESTYGLGYLDLSAPGAIEPVTITGQQHIGMGELETLERIDDNRYVMRFNIDGSAWLYVGHFDEAARTMTLRYVLCGDGELANGVLEGETYDHDSNTFLLSFSTAVAPTRIYKVSATGKTRTLLTSNALLELPESALSPGEDASFTSHDGLRVSARLYRPAPELGFEGKHPLVVYVHGGPQSQERPNFAWFSMPLIQFLTLNGFAVFVPNVRGSTGYGLDYTKHVDRDWGGKDMEDHIFALDLLAQDPGIDTSRAAVVGRSYGGYMTLMLSTRHADRWKAAVDMFGPYDLLTFLDRIPETWKPYFNLSLGNPTIPEDHAFLVERSPRAQIDALSCPMLVIQGKNDPRVVEAESRDLVEYLRGIGKNIDYLMFENEGHDVLKYENRVRCYTAITDFFKQHLQP